ncbi:MAG: HAD family hydrolase [Pseudomonadota bacterium]
MPDPSPRPCVIFDFDGTLADSVDGIVVAVSDTLARYGYPARSPSDIVDHMGRGLGSLYTWATGVDDLGALGPVVDATRARYSEVWRAHTRLFTGIPELLADLRARGAALGVLSNKGHEATVEVAEGLLPPGTFESVHGIAEGWPGKPNPQGLLRMVEDLGSTPSRTLMVGDMSVDVRVGRAAGIRTVGVTWGFQGPAAFVDDPPDFMVTAPEGILDLFDAV